MNETKRTYTKRSSRWYEKAGDRRTLLYNQAALASPIGQKLVRYLKESEESSLLPEYNNALLKIKRMQLMAEIAEIESAE